MLHREILFLLDLHMPDLCLRLIPTFSSGCSEVRYRLATMIKDNLKGIYVWIVIKQYYHTCLKSYHQSVRSISIWNHIDNAATF